MLLKCGIKNKWPFHLRLCDLSWWWFIYSICFVFCRMKMNCYLVRSLVNKKLILVRWNHLYRNQHQTVITISQNLWYKSRFQLAQVANCIMNHKCLSQEVKLSNQKQTLNRVEVKGSYQTGCLARNLWIKKWNQTVYSDKNIKRLFCFCIPDFLQCSTCCSL